MIKHEDPTAVFPDFSGAWIASFRNRHNLFIPKSQKNENGEVDEEVAIPISDDMHIKSDEEYLQLFESETDNATDYILARLNAINQDTPYPQDDDSISPDDPLEAAIIIERRSTVRNLSIHDKFDILSQAVEILREYKVSTKELKFARNLISGQL